MGPPKERSLRMKETREPVTQDDTGLYWQKQTTEEGLCENHKSLHFQLIIDEKVLVSYTI